MLAPRKKSYDQPKQHIKKQRHYFVPTKVHIVKAMVFPWWLSGKESVCQAENSGLIPDSGRSPGEGNDYTVWLWVPSVREGIEQCWVGSACCPSPIQWTICLYHIASPELITSGTTAFDSPLPPVALTERSDQWGMGWMQTQLSTSQRAKPEFDILIKD